MKLVKGQDAENGCVSDVKRQNIGVSFARGRATAETAGQSSVVGDTLVDDSKRKDDG